MVMGALTAVELASLIAGGEGSFVEFKEPATSTRDVAKELCALANAQGGHVLIGVDDNGTIVGPGDWNEERVMNLARTLIDPPPIPTYQRMVLPEGEIVVIGIDSGVEKPYAVTSGEARRYYLRVGSTSRDASGEELIRLTQASGAVAGDLRAVPGADLSDLDLELIAPRFENRRAIRWSELDEGEIRRLLTDAEILHADTQGPTVAGLLCFGKEPMRRLSYAHIACAAYPGTTVAHELVDRAVIGGRVDQQVAATAEFIERNLRQPSTVEGVTRREGMRPSRESIRELVANAVGHRDYGIAGPIQTRVFSDRIEIVSPGDLPNGVTPDSMRAGISVRRNQFIVQRLAEVGQMDALGRGFVLVVDECIERGLPEPVIARPGTLVAVTLFVAPVLSG